MLVQKSFGSKCVLSEKFQAALNKSGIIESVLLWSKFKADAQLKSKQSGKKTNKLRGMAKFEMPMKLERKTVSDVLSSLLREIQPKHLLLPVLE